MIVVLDRDRGGGGYAKVVEEEESNAKLHLAPFKQSWSLFGTQLVSTFSHQNEQIHNALKKRRVSNFIITFVKP